MKKCVVKCGGLRISGFRLLLPMSRLWTQWYTESGLIAATATQRVVSAEHVSAMFTTTTMSNVSVARAALI
jgi:hypothetical protein